ncbi:hypothetical protein Dip510_000561 [Elusimicrobium posterum]|uniref:hypothetical protein n=1 Tax=Elusimicrobium posterum TaxID=3116653 RepID=UPI003C70BD00
MTRTIEYLELVFKKHYPQKNKNPSLRFFDNKSFKKDIAKGRTGFDFYPPKIGSSWFNKNKKIEDGLKLAMVADGQTILSVYYILDGNKKFHYLHEIRLDQKTSNNNDRVNDYKNNYVTYNLHFNKETQKGEPDKYLVYDANSTEKVLGRMIINIIRNSL